VPPRGKQHCAAEFDCMMFMVHMLEIDLLEEAVDYRT